MKLLRLYALLLLLMNYATAFCQYDSLKGGGIYTSDFIINEIPRNITYYMPAGYGKSEVYPLLIFLHDDKSSAKNSIKLYGNLIHAKADSANCVIMYPDAIAGHWNSNVNTVGGSKDAINDVSFITLMLDFFIQQYHCDPDRIYLSGVGNGGNMCYRYNCEMPDKPAAIAPVNASAEAAALPGCRAKETVPISAVDAGADTKAAVGKAFEFLLMHSQKQ